MWVLRVLVYLRDSFMMAREVPEGGKVDWATALLVNQSLAGCQASLGQDLNDGKPCTIFH